jgi:hypothetical protein
MEFSEFSRPSNTFNELMRGWKRANYAGKRSKHGAK